MRYIRRRINKWKLWYGLNPDEYEFYPYDYEHLQLVDSDRAVVKVDLSVSSHYCGYVVIKNSKMPYDWRGNGDADALQYLNIHGGITYCKEQGKYTVFGFDCAHSGDDQNKLLKDPAYVMKLTGVMKQQILAYAKVINKWRKADKTKRIDMICRIHDYALIKSDFGLEMMIDVLCGGVAFKKELKIHIGPPFGMCFLSGWLGGLIMGLIIYGLPGILIGSGIGMIIGIAVEMQNYRENKFVGD